MNAQGPLVSVIVPTYRKWTRLRFVLQALDFQQGVDFEAVVCDDGSDDGDVESGLADVRVGYPIRYVKSSHAGAAAARNRAVEAACGRVLVFNDDDMVPGPGFLATHAAAVSATPDRLFRGERWALPLAAVPSVLERPVDPQSLEALWQAARLTVGEFWARRALLEGTLQTFRWAQTCTSNLSCDRQVFDALHGFDIAFGTRWGAEDTDFGFRAEQRGFSVEYLRSARNCHLEHSVSSAAKFREALPNYRYFVKKHRHPAAQVLYDYLSEVVTQGYAQTIFDEQNYVNEQPPVWTEIGA